MEGQTDGSTMNTDSSDLPVTALPNATEDSVFSSNGTTPTPLDRYPPEVLDAAVGCLIMFTIVGVSGNLISILALGRSHRLRNATTAFIINLCVADLIFCSFSTPFHAVLYLNPDRNWNEYKLCKLFPFVTYGNGVVSLFTVCAITINRYICICHPLRYRAIYKPYYVAIMIASLWMSAFFVLFLSLFEVWGKLGYRPETRTCDILLLNGKSPKKMIFYIVIGVPTLSFVPCYSRIYWVVRKAARRVKKSEDTRCETQGPPEIPNPHHLGVPLNTVTRSQEIKKVNKNRKDLKVLKVTMVIFLTYVLCYFPVSLMKLMRKEGDLLTLNVIVFLLVYLANCTNPIIYVVMSDEYRKAYVNLFTCRKEIYSTSSS